MPKKAGQLGPLTLCYIYLTTSDNFVLACTSGGQFLIYKNSGCSEFMFTAINVQPVETKDALQRMQDGFSLHSDPSTAKQKRKSGIYANV